MWPRLLSSELVLSCEHEGVEEGGKKAVRGREGMENDIQGWVRERESVGKSINVERERGG